MSAVIYDFNIEKGVDFSMSVILRRPDGNYADLSSPNVCVKADIVEFYELDPITGFTVQEVLPSGAILSLNRMGTMLLPYGECFYDVIYSESGVTERLIRGKISTSEPATRNVSCP